MRRRHAEIAMWLLAGALLAGCSDERPDFELWEARTTSRVTTDRTYLRDSHGRYVTVHGVNVGGSTKVPLINVVDGSASYIGRPFVLECDPGDTDCKDADWHFAKLRELGFNTVRLLFIWEAVEPHAKDQYDEEFLDYFEAVISKAKDHGIYVLINMHENLWSRHLYVDWNRPPLLGEQGDMLGIVGATIPNVDPEDPDHDEPGEYFTDRVQGDGAPLWATKACLPEKAEHIGGPAWGTFRPLGFLDLDKAVALLNLFGTGVGGDDTDIYEMAADVVLALGYASDAGILAKSPEQATDMMPWTFWGTNAALSMDVGRCYAAFFNGDKAFPGMKVGWKGEQIGIQEYLQDSFTNVWVEVAKRGARYDNVIGYDLMNEPNGIFVLLTAFAAFFQSGLTTTVEDLVLDLLGPEMGEDVNKLIFGLNILPQISRRPEQREGESEDEFKVRLRAWEAERDAVAAQWGLAGANLMELLNMNINFDATFLQPLYERVGQAIQQVDPNAIIWIEQAGTIDVLLGGGIGGQWADPMTVPAGVDRVVWSPHWYPDIYPMLGFGMPPRAFNEDEHEYRDYTSDLQHKLDFAEWQFSNVPSVFGEFGTYWNYNGIDWSREHDYIISSHILDNYYEAFEALNTSRILWCYTADNSYRHGDHWNAEDFSVLDPNQEARGGLAFSRPYARSTSGKPLTTRFYSDFHYYDPEEAVSDPVHEFELTFETRETDAPTEIYVPRLQYPDGFYLWLSDGYAAYNEKTQILYYQPTRYQPHWVHQVTIRPPRKKAGQENLGWDYFFRGDKVVSGGR